MLTDAQVSVLRTAILAETDPVFVAYRNEGATGMMAEWFNQPTNPPFVVWRTFVTQDEIMQNGFDWTRVDNLSVGKARIWEWMFNNEQRAINPSKPNVRAGIDATWVGTSADLQVRAVVYTHCKRPATRAEKLFATGTGTDASPALLVFEGSVSDYDVIRAVSQG